VYCTDITDHEIDININILLVTHSWGPQVYCHYQKLRQYCDVGFMELQLL